MAVKYIPYYPNTIEGQAILDNFARTRRVLKYRDNDKVVDKIRRGMPLYEMELQERVGENKDKNLVVRGECVSACAYLKEQGVEIDLVYIDPPFASGADYAKKVYIRRNPQVAEAIAKAEEEMTDEDLKSFDEKMYGDVWDKEKYLNWMYENLMAIKSVMSETASIYVHLDWHIGHYVKILMDEIFGEDNYRNELIWQKIRTTKAQSSSFGNVHDVIFYYNKSTKGIYNNIFSAYSKEYIETHYKKDEFGRFYTDVSMIQKGNGEPRYFNGKLISPPNGMHWIWSQQRIDTAFADGKIIINSKGTPRKKQYLDEMEGNVISDLWNDIYPVNSQAKEDENYTTQKPEALLERVIKASSNEGMVVADFFGGSGVTAAVAGKLGRRFIHCDVGINSIQTVRDRRISNGAQFDILEIKDGVSLFRNPIQTMDKLKSLIQGLRDTESLSKFWAGALQDSKLGVVPVYLPNLLDSSSKLMDIPQINHIVRVALPELPNDIKKVVVYYIDIIDIEEIERFINDNNDLTTIDVELRDLKEVLDDVVIEDYAEFVLKETADSLFKGWQIDVLKFLSDRVQQKIDTYNQKGEVNKFRGDEDEESDEEGQSKKKKKFNRIEISNTGLELVEFLSVDCTSNTGAWHSDGEVKIDKLGYVTRNGQKTKEFWDGSIKSDKLPLRLKIRNICGDETIYKL